MNVIKNQGNLVSKMLQEENRRENDKSLFSHGHATLHLAVSVGPSVGPSVCLSHFTFCFSQSGL